jgi:transcription elongation factor GreA
LATITIKGKQKIEQELKRLKEVERPSVIKAIEEARAHGDLSENAEYAAAKERQSFVEGRIAELSSKIPSFHVVDTSTINSDKVVFGATVTLTNLNTNEEVKYQLVGEDESDPSNCCLSIMSPIARAMVGKKEGDIVLVRSPKGETEYEIIKIEYV